MAVRNYKHSYRNKKSKLPAWLAAIISAVSILLGSYSYYTTGTPIPSAELFDGRPTIRFIDVGQGDCTLITYKGESVLIDAGPAANGESTAAYVKAYAPEIDYFIITHPHEDHMGGAADILSSVFVKNIIMLDMESNNRFYRNAEELIEEKNINVIFPEDDAIYGTENITITVLDSSIPGVTDPNNVSIISRIDVGATSIMSVGDAEAVAEIALLENYEDSGILDCDILKVGHHGSSTSTTEEFLYAVSPEECVISCGADNSYGHPHRETVELLSEYDTEVYRTDVSGTVVLRGLSK